MEIAISPYSTNKSRPFPHDYATKVALFWERFHGWKFSIAHAMLYGYEVNGIKHPMIPHSGYAALDAMFSYFEPLGKHLDGYLDSGGKQKSGVYFKRGVKDVFDFSSYDSTVIDPLLDILWSGIRCGLYHTGQTKKGVLISGKPSQALSFAIDDEIVIVNPHKLAEGLIIHVAAYRDRLISEGEMSQIGQNFLARYDFDNQTI